MGITSSRDWIYDEFNRLSRSYKAFNDESKWMIKTLNKLSEHFPPHEAAEHAIEVFKWRLHRLQNRNAYADWDCNENNLRWMTQEILLIGDDWDEEDDFDGVFDLFECEIVIDKPKPVAVPAAELEFQDVDVNAPNESVSIKDIEKEGKDSLPDRLEQENTESDMILSPTSHDTGLRHRNLMTEQV